MHFLEHILLLRIDIVQSNKKTKQKTKNQISAKVSEREKFKLKNIACSEYCVFKNDFGNYATVCGRRDMLQTW